MGHPVTLTVERTARKEYTVVLSDEQYQSLLSDGLIPHLDRYQQNLSTCSDTECDCDYDYKAVDIESDKVLVPFYDD